MINILFWDWLKSTYPNVNIREVENTGTTVKKQYKIKLPEYQGSINVFENYHNEVWITFWLLDGKNTVKVNAQNKADIVRSIENVWGKGINKEEQKNEEVKEKPTKPDDPKPEPKPKLENKKEEGRNSIIQRLRGQFKERLILEKQLNGSLEVIIDGNPGPLLYDYGVSPSSSTHHIFIPYSRPEKVNEIIEKYLTLINS